MNATITVAMDASVVILDTGQRRTLDRSVARCSKLLHPRRFVIFF
jgi:hypothetical protein